MPIVPMVLLFLFVLLGAIVAVTRMNARKGKGLDSHGHEVLSGAYITEEISESASAIPIAKRSSVLRVWSLVTILSFVTFGFIYLASNYPFPSSQMGKMYGGLGLIFVGSAGLGLVTIGIAFAAKRMLTTVSPVRRRMVPIWIGLGVFLFIGLLVPPMIPGMSRSLETPGNLSPYLMMSSAVALLFMLATSVTYWNMSRKALTADSVGKSRKNAKASLLDAHPVTIANYVLPERVEPQHILFAGQTGTGKSQGICRILETVRLRGSKALVADASGSFLSKLGGDDLVLNPFDRRSVAWSPFVEIREPYDCSLIARAVVPEGAGSAQEWNHYAQEFFAETLRTLWQSKTYSIRVLLYMVSSASRAELADLLRDSSVRILTDEGNDRMLSGVRGVLSTFLAAWQHLPDMGDFSIRDWLSNEQEKRWLFLTYRDDQAGMLRPLVSTMLSLAITEGLSLRETSATLKRDVWLIFDEVDSLGKVGSLKDGLAKLRKYGCKCVFGLQTIAQLRATYGRDEAQVLMANIATKALLRAGDGETADYFSSEIGDQQIVIKQHTRAVQSSDTSVNQIRRAILGSEFTSLPDLEGFLKTPGGVMKIRLQYSEYLEKVPAYLSLRSEDLAALNAKRAG